MENKEAFTYKRLKGWLCLLLFLFPPLFFQHNAYPATIDKTSLMEYGLSREEEINRCLAKLEAQNQDPQLISDRSNKTLDIPQENTTTSLPVAKENKNYFFKKLNVHGFLETRHYFNIEKYSDYHYYDLRNDLRLERIFEIDKNFKAKLSLDGQYDATRTKAIRYKVEEARFKLWEAYAYLTKGKCDLRIGQQLIRWGKSDELNPTDVFTPEDYSELVNKNLRAERKIPVPAVKVDYYYVPNSAIEAIWVPIFVENKLGENGSIWEPYIKKYYNNLFVSTQHLQLQESKLSKQLDNSSFALKWMRTGENIDYSLSYSYHPDENPSYHLSLEQGKVFEQHSRQHTIGGDFETVIGKLGLRGEGAFTTKRNYVNNDIFDDDKVFRKDAFLSVLGTDYTFGQNLYFNLQYASEYIFRYQDFMLEQEYSNSFLWKINRKFLRDKLFLETIGRYFFSRMDYFCRFSLSYDLNDNLKFTSGVDYFGGEFDGTFGQFKKNDQVFVRMKYSF